MEITAVLKAAYPDPKFLPDKYAMGLWYEMLKDLRDDAALASARGHIASSRFFPTIADIRAGAADAAREEGAELTESEAWRLAYRAICNGIYRSEQEYAKLPPDVQRAVGGSPAALYALATDDKFNMSVAESNFMRSYRAAVAERRHLEKLPESMRIPAGQTRERIGARQGG